jgi:hypothetical protein
MPFEKSGHFVSYAILFIVSQRMRKRPAEDFGATTA